VKARSKGILLRLHLSPGTPISLVGDSGRLKQILINLLGNAVKFTNSGEIALSVRNIDVGPPAQLEFCISDTGIGIPPDKLETIFDDFTQVDSSTTRKYGGTGLGLGISRRLVEAMGGRLTATSTVGKGSTFRFTIKIDPVPGGSKIVRASLDDLRGKRALALVDDTTDGLVLRETFLTWGLESDAFHLTTAALAGLPEFMNGRSPYSLAVIDICKAGMDVFAAAARIRQVAPDLPIVLLTSDPRPGDTTRCLEANLSGYAVKPVARAHLFRLVYEAMAVRVGLELQLEKCDHEPEGVKPAKILVAEDSQDNRLLVQVYLKDNPYQLTFEENGQAAVDRFASNNFDLVLMDVQMPVMDGLVATRTIRELERGRNSDPTPIVALTSNASLQDMERSSAAGCSAHLTKPISKTELIDAIEKHRR
jgi:two-component system sensor histidine kinase/response regulator